MLALVTEPGHAHTTHIEDLPAVEAREGEVLVRTLEVGVCGTDREISEGLFGVAPEGDPLLVSDTSPETPPHTRCSGRTSGGRSR